MQHHKILLTWQRTLTAPISKSYFKVYCRFTFHFFALKSMSYFHFSVQFTQCISHVNLLLWSIPVVLSLSMNNTETMTQRKIFQLISADCTRFFFQIVSSFALFNYIYTQIMPKITWKHINSAKLLTIWKKKIAYNRQILTGIFSLEEVFHFEPLASWFRDKRNLCLKLNCTKS